MVWRNNTIILTNLSKKKNLSIFIGTENYPGSKDNDFDYAIGDLSDETLNKVSVKPYMKELYQAVTPFQYDSEQDKVVFYPNYIN